MRRQLPGGERERERRERGRQRERAWFREIDDETLSHLARGVAAVDRAVKGYHEEKKRRNQGLAA